jgi:hypothetical protein
MDSSVVIEDLEKTVTTLGRRVNARLTTARDEVNRILEEYGLEVELSFDIRYKNTDKEETD